MKNKIAFIFLLYNGMNHEDLWKKFFMGKEDRYNIYIYSQKEYQQDSFRDHVVEIDFPTAYGDSSIVLAQNKLLELAMKDESNTHFIFLSWACIPVKSFDYIQEFLKEEHSYFNVCPDTQVERIPEDYRSKYHEVTFKKSSQWCILNRRHTSVLLENQDFLEDFDFPYIAPDEHIYISKLYTDWLESELICTPNISVWATTFTNWSDVDYKYNFHHEWLKNYSHIDTEELLYIIDSPSLFARKFLTWCTTDGWKDLSWYILNACNL